MADTLRSLCKSDSCLHYCSEDASTTDMVGRVPFTGKKNKPQEIKPSSVNQPSHYTEQVPGIECIDIVSHFNFNRGNIIKYAWRCGDKGNPIEDLEKVKVYADFEIQRLKERARRKEAVYIPLCPHHGQPKGACFHCRRKEKS